MGVYVCIYCFHCVVFPYIIFLFFSFFHKVWKVIMCVRVCVCEEGEGEEGVEDKKEKVPICNISRCTNICCYVHLLLIVL